VLNLQHQSPSNTIGQPVQKVLCAPDSFKETLTAAAVAAAMEAGVRQAAPHVSCDCCPVGDGGEGTLDALAQAMQLELIQSSVSGPSGLPVKAAFGLCKVRRLAVVELAQASGLALVRQQDRNPLQTSTFGSGELMQQAAQRGCETIILCVGGSATIDAAAGILQALGVRFFDAGNVEIPAPITGGMLHRIARIDASGLRTKTPKIRVACDVTNPLFGPKGAAFTYGPQKGATPQQQTKLDHALRHFASVCRSQGFQADPNAIGSGAAGGVPFGLAAVCGSTLERGIDLVLEMLNFENRCRGASLVLTGEGQLDAQSLHGKACMGVAAAAAKFNVPTIAIVGSTGPGAADCTNPTRGGNLHSFISLAERFSIEHAMREPAMCITQACFELLGQLTKV
jgi:glycerate 2-kinase